MVLIQEQKRVCDRYGSPFCESAAHLKIGVSRGIKEGIWPIHGLRHPLKGDTTGWYIWTGEYSNDPDFFTPLHVEHLNELCPEVLKYLGLAPRWRFLVAPNHVDVWEDTALLDVD